MFDSVQECNKPETADRSRYRNLGPILGLVGFVLPHFLHFLSWYNLRLV